MTERASATRPREGFALAMAIIGIVLIGSLIASGFFLSTQEYRIGRNALLEQQAFVAAEHGMASTQSNWDRVQNLSMAFGQMRGPDTISTGNGTYAVVRVTRLNELTFWVVSEGYAGGTDAQTSTKRIVSSVLRVAYPTFNVRGALTVRGEVTVQGSSRVDGTDAVPYQWASSSLCPTPGTAIPGVAAPDTTKVCSGTCPGSGPYRLFGDPPEYQDPVAADTSTYFKYGDETWQSLTDNADIILSGGGDVNIRPLPVETGGKCDKSFNTNWGDPTRTTACGDYFPIIHVIGNLHVQSNSIGQGVLLVEGDMDMQGDFEFNGIVIVRDDIKSTGNGNKITGAAFAGNTYVTDASLVSGNAEITYSSCAIDRASKGSSILVRAKERGWAELF